MFDILKFSYKRNYLLFIFQFLWISFDFSSKKSPRRPENKCNSRFRWHFFCCFLWINRKTSYIDYVLRFFFFVHRTFCVVLKFNYNFRFLAIWSCVCFFVCLSLGRAKKNPKKNRRKNVSCRRWESEEVFWARIFVFGHFLKGF